MNHTRESRMEKVAENVWRLPFELSVIGVNVGRNVTIIRLSSGEVLVHSTGPFTSDHVEQVQALGRVRWITDPMIDHDTFTRQGLSLFRSAEFLAPEGFPKVEGVDPMLLLPVPNEWGQEVEVIRLEGTKGFNEHVFYHVPSKTLIVCDLLMNFPNVDSLWEGALLRLGLGPERAPGTSRRLIFAIKDEEAFRASIRRVMEWPFERVIVGHGEPICENAYERSKAAFQSAGWLSK